MTTPLFRFNNIFWFIAFFGLLMSLVHSFFGSLNIFGSSFVWFIVFIGSSPFFYSSLFSVHWYLWFIAFIGSLISFDLSYFPVHDLTLVFGSLISFCLSHFPHSWPYTLFWLNNIFWFIAFLVHWYLWFIVFIHLLSFGSSPLSIHCLLSIHHFFGSLISLALPLSVH